MREGRGTFPLRGKKARIFVLPTARKIEGERTPWKEIECERSSWNFSFAWKCTVRALCLLKLVLSSVKLVRSKGMCDCAVQFVSKS